MTEKSEDTDPPQIYASNQEIIEEALRILADFDDTPPTQMTPLFYQHGFEELRMITRDLLRSLGHGPDA